MGVIVAISVIVASVVGAAFSQLLSDEFKAWMPWLVEQLIRRAVLRLPAELRERFGEEWRSHVVEIPGQLGRVFSAAGFMFASRSIGIEVVSECEIQKKSKSAPTILMPTKHHRWSLDEELIKEYNLDRVLGETDWSRSVHYAYVPKYNGIAIRKLRQKKVPRK